MGQVGRHIYQVVVANEKIQFVLLIMALLGFLLIWAHLALPATFEFEEGGENKPLFFDQRSMQVYMGLREAKKEERVLEIQYKPDHFSSLLAHVW